MQFAAAHGTSVLSASSRGGPRGVPARFLHEGAWRECVVSRADRHLGDIGTEGTWAAARVNDVIRASRYGAGGHFAPHRDGVIQPREGERSFLTMLVYLLSLIHI